jgi:hypothetical protein
LSSLFSLAILKFKDSTHRQSKSKSREGILAALISYLGC